MDHEAQRRAFGAREMAAAAADFEATQMSELSEDDPALDVSAEQEDAAWGRLVGATDRALGDGDGMQRLT